MFSGYLPLILTGMLWTIAIALVSLVVGLMLGVVMAAGELSRKPLFRWPTLCLTSMLRGLPEIVVLFFCYFGGAIILSKMFGHYVGINSFVAGVLSLGLIFGGYSAEVFRGAFYQIPRGQFDSIEAIGLSSIPGFRKIILPQMLHHAKPGLSNLWLSLLKDTSLVSLIGFGEMMNNIGLAASQTHQAFVFYALAAVIYLLLTSVSKRFFEGKTAWIS